MRKSRNMVAGTALAALLMVVSLAPAAHAETAPVDPTDDGDTSSEVIEVEVTGPATPEATQDPSGSEKASRAAAPVCTFVQRVDFVHISSSGNPMAAQSHGNWDKGNCTNYTLADVTTQIDRKNFLGLWQAVGAPGKKRLAPNPSGLTSGGAGRVTARYVCNGTAAGSFRSYTDIDVVGYADTPNAVFSSPINLICG
ncbi:hypothetical protein [Microbacterium sp. NPDC089695]|uniref:hypothetical protein n=1 Tax=Microbacterium sp. NPDC089695 TaxID=3364198 RepID=UPI0037F70C4B